jgi:hypothetical protein
MDAQGSLGAASSRQNGSGPAHDFDLVAWVRRSTAAQGVPEKLADEDVILAAARLLRPALKPHLPRLPRRRPAKTVVQAPGAEETACAG